MIEENGGEIHEVRRPLRVNGIELAEYEENGECYATVDGGRVNLPYEEIYKLARDRRIRYANGNYFVVPEAEAK